LAVITYQMLSGKFPYGREIAQANSISAQRKLHYKSIINDDSELPIWIDDTLERALKMNPLQRYSVLSEFIHDLRQPSTLFLAKTKPPLIQRDPVMFWQGISLILFVLLIIQTV
jgi:serine/threonine protein kinase